LGRYLPLNYLQVNCPIISFLGYGGQAGGSGLADILFGDAAPAGRLPQTIYPLSYVNEVSMMDMGMRPNATTGNPGRGYRYYTGQAVLPFGFGLSYSTFTFDWSGLTNPSILSARNLQYDLELHGPSLLPLKTVLTIEVNVTNTGAVLSDIVVLAYIIGPNHGVHGNPIQSLADFTRIHSLAPGRSQVVQFALSAAHFSRVLDNGKRVAVTGDWKIRVEDMEHIATVIT
jgi:hypothetical protein